MRTRTTRGRHHFRTVQGRFGAILSDAQERALVARNLVRELHFGRRRGKERRADRRRKGKLKVGVDVPQPTEIKSLIKTVEGRWRPHFFDSHIHWTSRKLSHRYPMNIVSKIAVTDGPSTLSSTPGSPRYAIGLRTLPRPLDGQDRPRRKQCASLARRVSEIIETQTGKPLSRTSRQATINQSLPSDLGIRWLGSNQIIGCPAGVLKTLEQTFLEWAGTSRRRANSPRLVRLHRPCDHILRDPAERFIERRNGLSRCDRRKFLAFLE